MDNPHIPHPRIKERLNEKPHLTKDEHLGLNGHFALFISSKFGTIGAFYTLLALMIGWMFLATLEIGLFRKDPYPFTFLLLISNLIQLSALPILAVGQQVLSRTSDKQAEQTFKDAEAILRLQDEVHRLLKINIELTQEIRDTLDKIKK